ncbi:WD40 repeat domain-containing protein [Nocardia sp. NPDC052001]|uniref:WD40 repeat domain-containing protein n=1 Tax=Nocardia sp. NPDC052001 TaxID=3154853 RepID=UPI003423B229
MSAPGGSTPRLSPRTVFLHRFTELWAAAGNPTLDVVSRATASLPGREEPIPVQRISDWRSGRAVPAKWEAFDPVLCVLRRLARESDQPVAPPHLFSDHYWERLWRRTQVRGELATAGHCPYPGLTEYQQADHELFSGREQATTDLLALIRSREGSMVAMVGASGAGKSSLLAAGVAATLDSEGWAVHTITPGRVTAAEISEISWDDAEHRLLVVDQFEELFTTAASIEQHKQFLEALESCRALKGSSTTVVIAIRADFYARCMEYPILLEALGERSYLLGPMNHDELTRAVTRPATLAGCTLDSGLCDVVINELCGLGTGTGPQAQPNYDPSLLPLLSHVMAATWQQRKGRKLTITGYRAAGGVQGSVTAAAERAWNELTRPQRTVARNILLSLVTAGHDTKDTRRIASRDDIVAADPEALTVLEVLARSRLVTLETDTVYLTHEIVLDNWARLRDWLEQDRVGVLERQRVSADAREWVHAGRPASRLYSAARLAEARSRAGSDGLGMVAADFLAATELECRRQARRRSVFKLATALASVVVLVLALLTYRIANQENHQRQLTEQSNKDKLIARLASQAEAMETTDPSLSAQLMLAAFQMRPDDDELRSRLLRYQTLPLATTLRGHTDRVTQVSVSRDGALLASASSDDRVLVRRTAEPTHALQLPETGSDPVSSVVFSPAAPLLAIGTDASLRLWDLSDPVAPRPFGPAVASGRKAVHLAFSPDGRTLAAGNEDKSITLWSIADPRSPTPQQILDAPLPVRSLIFNRDGRKLVTAHNAADAPSGEFSTSRTTQAPQVLVWSLDRPQSAPIELPAPGLASRIDAVAFDPITSTLAVGIGGSETRPDLLGDASVQLWSLTDDSDPRPLGSPLRVATRSGLWALAFNHDGTTLAAGVDDGARLWNLTDPQAPTPLGSPLRSGPPRCANPSGTCYTGTSALAYLPSDDRLVAGEADGTLRLWSPAPAIVGGVAGHLAPRTVDHNGHLVISGFGDGHLQIFDASNPFKPRKLTDIPGQQAALRSDGRQMVAALDNPPRLEILDLSSPSAPAEVGVIPDASIGRYIDDTHVLVVSAFDGSENQLWDIANAARPGHVGTIPASALYNGLPLNRRLLGTEIDQQDHHLMYTLGIDETPSGGVEQSIKIWSLSESFQPVLRARIPADPDALYSGPIAVQERFPALIVFTNTEVHLWKLTDPDHPEPLGPFTAAGINYDSAALSADHHWLANVARGVGVQIADLSKTTRSQQLPPSIVASSAVDTPGYSDFLPGSGYLLMTGINGLWVVLDLDVRHTADRICSTTGAMTASLWNTYAPGTAFIPTCPH